MKHDAENTSCAKNNTRVTDCDLFPGTSTPYKETNKDA